MRRGRGFGSVAVAILLMASPALASAPASANPQVSPQETITPFESHSTFQRFNTFDYSWPGNPAKITVDNKVRKLREPVKEALSIWNATGIDVKWKLKPGGKTDVKVVKYGNASCGNGLATTTVNSRGRAISATVYLGTNSNTEKCIYTDVLTAAHEFGHVLGLGHEDSECAVMNSFSVSSSSGTHPNAAWPFQCEPEPDAWYCRVLSQDDLKGAKSIYGGKFEVRDPEFCPVSAGL